MYAYTKKISPLPCFIFSNNHILKLGIGDKVDNSCIIGNSVTT